VLFLIHCGEQQQWVLLVVQAELHGVLPIQQAAFGPLQSHASRWTNQLRQAFAACHSLSMVSKSVVAGDDMERTLFKAVEARFLVKHPSCNEPKIGNT
jgi:hypothetical protein